MPANLTPDYKKADEWYRSASTDEEKMAALEEMLRTIPKHKGTEGLQADIKRKMSKLRAAAESGVKKGGVKHADVFHVPRGGAGQVVLLGLPNCGKSSIVGHLTNAHVNVADYPFATDKPVPGMMKHEDVPIQVVDMPPITAEFAPPGMVNTLRSADIIAIVVDLSADVLEQLEACTNYLDSHKLLLPADTEKDAEWIHLARPAFVVATKADIAPPGTLETLKELTTRPFEYIEISTKTGTGLNVFTRRCFDILGVVRVYAKKPGKEPDMHEPFTLPHGSTVEDLAFQVHRQLAEHLKNARAWHSNSVHDGQSVPREHELCDKEIIELHFA